MYSLYLLHHKEIPPGLFRMTTTWAEFLKKAKGNHLSWRGNSRNVNPEDENHFVTSNAPQQIQKFYKDYDFDILKSWLNIDPGKYGSSDNRDLNFLQAFLDANIERGLPDIVLPSVIAQKLTQFLPQGAPLAAYLQNHISLNQAGWSYPSSLYMDKITRSSTITNNSLAEVKMMEVTLGVTEIDEMQQTFSMVEGYMEDGLKNFPIKFVSFDVESFAMPRELLTRLIERKKTWTRQSPTFTFKVPKFNHPGKVNIPARMILGDGSTWFLSIRFNFDETAPVDGTRRYRMRIDPLPQEFIDFITSLPPLVGLNIMDDRDEIEDTLFNLYGLEVKLPVCVELDSLALALGSRLSRTNMFTMNLINMGSLLNKHASVADGHWPLPLEELADPFKLYCLGDVRFGHNNFVVLISMLIRDIFPDPDVFCSTMELRQSQAFKWFGHMVINCLGETKLHPVKRDQAKTRQELIKSLRKHEYLSNGTKRMETEPSPGIIAFSELIPDWPSMIRGGPVDLHAVTSTFASQFGVLQKMRLSPADCSPRLDRVVNEDFIRIVTFERGITAETGLGDYSEAGLVARPELAGNLFKIDLNDLSNNTLVRMATQTGQGRVPGILEWARLNPYMIKPLLLKLKLMDMTTTPKPFWIEKTAVYERLRLMHSFLFNQDAPVVSRIEQAIWTKQARVVDQEEGAWARNVRVLTNRNTRLNLYNTHSIGAVEAPTIRTGAQQQVYGQIPGDNHARNLRKREKTKQKIQNLKRLGRFIPKTAIRGLIQQPQQPQSDLRTVLNKKRLNRDRVIRDTCELGSSDGPDTLHAEVAEIDDQRSTDNWDHDAHQPVDYEDPLPGPSGLQQAGGYDYGVQDPYEDRSRPHTHFENERHKKGKRNFSRQTVRLPGYVPAGYSSDESSDDCYNSYVDNNMISMGIYPKRKQRGLSRY